VSCLVTDVRLRGISGLDLLDRVAKMSLRIPTIVISARADGRVRDEAFIGGAVEFLRKPIVAAELISSIQAALRDPTGRRDDPPSE
jgi:FixJ family two-component response regulator